METRKRHVQALLAMCFGIALTFGLCVQAWAADGALTGGYVDDLGTRSSGVIELVEGVDHEMDITLAEGESLEASVTIDGNGFAYFVISCAANSEFNVAIIGQGRTIEGWSEGSAGGQGVHGPVPLHVGTYTLNITSNKDNSCLTGLGYTLANPSWMDLSYIETEPDNNSLPGEPLPVGKTIAGSLSNDSSEFTCFDADKFALTLSEDSHVTIDFYAPGVGGVLTVALCSTDGNSLLAPVEGKRLEWMTAVSDASSPIQVADLTNATLECGNIPAGEYTVYIYGAWMSLGGTNYWTQSFYQLCVNVEPPLPVADPSCAVLTKDGEVQKSTTTGEPVDGVWSYKEMDAVTKLFIAADVQKVTDTCTTWIGSSSHSWSLDITFENIQSVEFLCDSQGKSAVTALGEHAFQTFDDDMLLDKVENLDKTQLVSIGAYAFDGQKNLKNIKLPLSLTSIGGSAFEGCESLVGVSLPPSLASIGGSAFEGCESLAYVDGFDATRVLEINSWTFYGCRSLSNIVLPKGLASIEYSAFGMCSSLKTVTVLSPDCTSIDSAAFTNSHLDSVSDNDSIILVHRSAYPAFCKAGASKSWGTRIGILTGTKGSLVGAEISGLDRYKTYNGAPQTQALTVMYGDLRLKEGADYSLSYKNNVKSGEASVIVSGVGNYAGSQTLKFTIDKAFISDASVFGLKPMDYLGRPVTPKPIVKFGGVVLVEGVDYELSYRYNNAPGFAYVYLKGINSCLGSSSERFEIKQASNKVTVAKSNVKKVIKYKALKKRSRAVALPKVTTKYGRAKWRVTARDKKKVLDFFGSKVRVIRGAKKGTYTIKLKAFVTATRTYKGASSKVVTIKVVVK